ncbi:hypothetical protein A2954_00530 [Candidatus Roizmanbacteria bacterium RIFCSPLOWO2_01_FULL_37_12]|uniref:Bacterial Ig domain-containing protein n=1 Tax=Candidatus Roizmanbacteria bacterium RIFCSPLOWO2_01_FULL_37_12 TaxID=1802056 RepID=A0A1F7I9R1_9BACT|nr:MAG: hypothetical protein A3D76_00885 [Candidatus Roizmanbacteria bacterium RIFCSPHIGHO2_02_FULL_37_9b]OGK40111.1 MAG: hypothetical protein A2954_00530 [Candidatus Roizmanbacteria bacterium RIFCSPLOWO2_01_FULL_37_12]
MKKDSSDNKVLLVGIIVTVLIIAVLLVKKVNGPTNQNVSPDQTESDIEKGEQTVSEPEPSAEEGLYLEVKRPADGDTVASPSLTVMGITETNAEVFINETELRADLQGNFSSTITLEEGENVIVITASDEEGNYSEKTLTVTYEPSG